MTADATRTDAPRREELNHTADRSTLKRRAYGLWYLMRMSVGHGAETTQETATHVLMLVGFAIEGSLLFQAAWRGAKNDFSGPLGVASVQVLLMIVLTLVVALLLFHQFMIFRNFTVPRTAARTRGTPVPQVRRSQKLLEVSIYFLFGVLTGEAGYALTLVYQHNQSNWSASALKTLFGTDRGYSPLSDAEQWGLTLLCTFLLCATIICLLVLAWDFVASRDTHQRSLYPDGLLSSFKFPDFLSALFWFCLLLVVSPRFRWSAGVRHSPLPDLGHFWFAWAVLGMCSLLYLFLMLRRVFRALDVLGAAADYPEARSLTL